ncbi:MAG: hypothetical protein GAK31_02365 [Stenotrophomonas maltophilia]|uniref:Uncharacterized protein n=1 Tax=Stenotrophomonas maltophilia TaxID=40324 RepID=A0A7V8FG33_STEMA|nr:MAG: hypothetical protein GAK31_02365 [Stenotrophomonas maltophilia]
MNRPAPSPRRSADRPDPRLLRTVRQLALAGLAWWALLRFPLPRWAPRRAQARRRPRPVRRAHGARQRAAAARVA